MLNRRMKKLCDTVILFVSIFLVAGGVSYTMALLGLPVPTPYVTMFITTPFAMILIGLGTTGLLILSRCANPTSKRAWYRLLIGFGLVIVSAIYLEALLYWSWGQDYE